MAQEMKRVSQFTFLPYREFLSATSLNNDLVVLDFDGKPVKIEKSSMETIEDMKQVYELQTEVKDSLRSKYHEGYKTEPQELPEAYKYLQDLIPNLRIYSVEEKRNPTVEVEYPDGRIEVVKYYKGIFSSEHPNMLKHALKELNIWIETQMVYTWCEEMKSVWGAEDYSHFFDQDHSGLHIRVMIMFDEFNK